MRSKDQIIEQLNSMPKPYGSINQSSTLATKIMIEMFVDIRDELTALITILGSIEKVIYRSG